MHKIKHVLEKTEENCWMKYLGRDLFRAVGSSIFAYIDIIHLAKIKLVGRFTTTLRNYLTLLLCLAKLDARRTENPPLAVFSVSHTKYFEKIKSL